MHKQWMDIVGHIASILPPCHTKNAMAFIKMKEEVIVPSVDIRGYAKYILQEGANEEKRELLGCLKSRIYLTEKKISLEKK